MNKVITLGEICDKVKGVIKTGPFGSQLHESDYSNDGIPVVMPINIIDRRIITDSIARVAPEHVERLSKHKLKAGDIIFGRRGEIGRQALVHSKQEGWLCGTGCIRISLGDTVIKPLYLHYYLCHPDVISWISNQAIGATLPNLNTSILRSVPVSVPSLLKQGKISFFLSAYDDLIENNLRRIKILEEMAQNLYREWFVNFRFPGHEQVRFVDSPLGRIPEGWEVVKLGELIKIRKGKNITKKTIVKGTIPVIAGGKSPAYYHNSPNTMPPVITISASGANAGYVCLYHEAIWASDCSVIDMDVTKYIYYYYLQLSERHVEVTNLQRGSAQPHVYSKDLMELEALNVPFSVLNCFNDEIKPIYNMIRILSLKSKTLRQTRDLLLPKLISGEVDVSELDIKVPEEVAS